MNVAGDEEHDDMALLEAVVPFAPVPHLLPSETRQLLTETDRGPHGRTWRLRPEVRDDPAALAAWHDLRRRYEHVFPLGPRWQLDGLLGLARDQPRLVHLHDLADDLAEGTHQAGPVLADVPSAVAAEAVAMVAELAGAVEEHPGAGCCVTGPGGGRVWQGAALAGAAVVCDSDDRALVLEPTGRLRLGRLGFVDGWQVTPEAVTVTLSDPAAGTSEHPVDGAVAACLRTLASDGAETVGTCSAADATSAMVAALADALGTAARFQRSVLIEQV